VTLQKSEGCPVWKYLKCLFIVLVSQPFIFLFFSVQLTTLKAVGRRIRLLYRCQNLGKVIPTWGQTQTSYGVQRRPKTLKPTLIIFQFRKLLRVLCQGELVVYDFWACAMLLSISSWLNVISLPSQKLSVHFLIYLHDTLTAFPLIQTLTLMSLPLLIILRNEIYSKKGIKSILTTSKFLGFGRFLMNTETMAPGRIFTKEIFLAPVSWPFQADLLSVDHSKWISPCSV
jgi:hypothetical protein